MFQEGFVDLIQFDDHISLVNMRRLKVKMVVQNGEVWVETKKERISLDNLRKYVKFSHDRRSVA